jgi:predicted AlkP superfamily pyrophosphatase or phosphodiesterase
LFPEFGVLRAIRAPVTDSGDNRLKSQDFPMRPLLRLAAALAITAALAAPAAANPVLMISIDGLRPADITDAPARGLKVPTLRAIMANGAWASGARNVLPTITYPNHTTLVTGAAPAVHGITGNTTFDPMMQNQEGWYWYARDMRVGTLWDAVHRQGKLTASINWPVSVAAPVDFDIPEYWRARTPEDVKLVNALSTPGLVDALSTATGIPALKLQGEEPESDEARTRYAAALIAAHHPQFFTLHVSSLDHYEHKFGPGSPEAKATLEKIDGYLGKLIADARKAEPDLVVAIVSDHGFASVQHDVNLATVFINEGLIKLDDKYKVASWDAAPWSMGGSIAVVLADPKNQEVHDKVAAILNGLAANPASGFAKVIDKAGIAAMGGGTEPDFWVDLAIGYEAGRALTGPLVSDGTNKGMHGYFPTHMEMRSTFMIEGPGLPKKGALGEVDMRDIAPTIAKILGTTLPQATGKPLF